jgi:hypothetical protein
LGEENSFYYDPELKKWVNKKDPNSTTPTARSTPPAPKGSGPQSRSASAGSVSSAGGFPQRPPPSSVQSAPGSDGRPSTGALAPPALSGSPTLGSLPMAPNGPPRSVSTSAAGLTPPGSSGGLAPPSRPATSLSHASSIDDLLGAPQARKGNTVRSKKKGRGYVDVMAK